MRLPLLLLGLAACAAPAAPAAPLPPIPSPTDAQNAAWRRLLEEAMQPSVAEQADIAVSEQFTQQAKAWIGRGDFEKGRVALQEALRRWPQNWEARRLFGEVNEIVSGETERMNFPSDVRAMRVRIEQALVEIGNNIANGERLYKARAFDEAVREFEEAEFKIKAMPAEVGVLREIEPRLAEKLKQARSEGKR